MPDRTQNEPNQPAVTPAENSVIYSDKVARDEPYRAENDEVAAEDQPQGGMSLIGHLEELRRRIIIMIVAIAAGSLICYFYATEITGLITAPAGKLYYMNPAEAFFTYLKVSVFAGFLLALPIVMYQIWSFVMPALTNNERTAGVFLVPASIILFFIGLFFSYYLVLPAGIKFFMGFANESLQPMFSISQYISFVISFLLPFGFIFELPLFILVMARVGLISSAFLTAKRKIVLVMSFVIGALISPTPDVFSQTMVAVPMILLYEVSLLIVKYILRK
ncbi:twin-arginine translocase subunit TatC [Sporomusa termitida]|uniref:Sec-independent protein translocase protein TatC n=1 Tax=Sporomusa termitida TaxID=2377 RepID=A0A517DRQ7_9FIRM|nr:twin-arginine translocase subunit TatC [Sporomusa termitida]QDR80045.1 Sec-independent protein translocase protein TatC [Sporomusa termitida]